MQYIEQLERRVGAEKLTSLEKWCDNKGVKVVAVSRLLNDANLPIIRIKNTFRGVYENHLNHVFDEETKRQLRLQIKNRMCARLLSSRQQEERKKNKDKSA